jgi:sugar lactone lactonase YvrE
MRFVKSLALIAVAGTALTGLAMTAKSAGTGIPGFTFDGTWPKMPLPNNWTFEGITGLAVDKNDTIWVLNRPGDYDNDPIFRRPEVTENYASLTPKTAMCCMKPEGILAFDQNGNLLKHWNQADKIDGHLILADKAGNIWIGSDTMRKYNQDGKLLGAIERVPAGNPKVGDFPPETPMFVGRVEGGEFDEDARELFVTDGYMRGRILVFDMDTMKFKRGWGAYGKPLKDIQFDPKSKYDPKAPPAKDFVGHLTLTVSKDGFVYAADRQADRIQVYTKAGKFVREYTVAPETLDRGSTGGMALSPDQKYIYVSDIMNNVVWIVDRMTDKTLGHFGYFGHTGGGFHWIHMVATDQHGNVYTGEVDTGKRVQRFLVKN